MSILGETRRGPAIAALGEPVPARSPSVADPVIMETVLRPSSGWVAINWKELLTARELLFFLIWRDVKIRYKQTILGASWAVLQPLFTMIIFSVIFGRLAGMPSEGFPYPIFVFAGLVPWTFFSGGVSQAAQSLINQQQLLTKIYFPRIFVPTAAAGAFVVDLLITLGLYACFMPIFHVVPSWRIVFLPAILVLTVLATLGLGYLLAALTVLYRDFRYVIPFMIQVLMYVSPVIYPASLLPTRYHALLGLNPMFGIIEAYRSTILGTPWQPTALASSTVSTLGLFVLGLFYFRKTERRFADIA
jgi:lipopolysaccharide transport system permease protein